MSIKDELVGTVIGAAENKLQGKEKEEKTTFGGVVLRFLISTIWVIITLVASVVAFYGMVAGQFVTVFLGNEQGYMLCMLAIGLCSIIFLLTFLIPYLRKKGSLTRWCGIVALGDALWWIYILISNN